MIAIWFSTGDEDDDDTSCKVILSNRKMSNVRLELNMAIHIEAAMRLLNSLRLSEDRRKEAQIQCGIDHFSQTNGDFSKTKHF